MTIYIKFAGHIRIYTYIWIKIKIFMNFWNKPKTFMPIYTMNIIIGIFKNIFITRS